MTDPKRIPTAMRERAQAIIDITDEACREHLDDEYGEIARRLIARLSRKRTSPLARGDARIWAAGVLYVAGQIKGGLINRTLDIGVFEPELTRRAMLKQHPMAWIVEVDGLLVDARMLSPELQADAVRLGLIPDLNRLRAAA